MNSPKVSLQEQIAYITEVATDETNETREIDQAILATLQSLASARDALEAGATALEDWDLISGTSPRVKEWQNKNKTRAAQLRSLVNS